MRLMADLALDGVTGKYFDRQRESQAHRRPTTLMRDGGCASSAPSCRA